MALIENTTCKHTIPGDFLVQIAANGIFTLKKKVRKYKKEKQVKK